MWWKLVGLGLLEAVLITLLVVPTPFKMQMTFYTTPEAAHAHAAEIYWQLALALGGLVLSILVLGTPIWLAYRVVKRARNSN